LRCGRARGGKRPVQEAVLAVLLARGRLRFKQIALATRVNRGSVWRALVALQRQGRVRVVEVEGRVFYEASGQ
jgi:DNA-binding IclR family transcriptional regulator